MAVAVVGLVGVAGLSRLPWTASGDTGAMLRLSWRLPALEVERCRGLTEEELERLPAHMRTPEVCEGEPVPYVLTVRIDGTTRIADTLRAAGFRSDRPVYVLREIPAAPGPHDLFVEMSPAGPDASVGEVLTLVTDVRLDSGQILLITYDANEGRLVVRPPL